MASDTEEDDLNEEQDLLAESERDAVTNRRKATIPNTSGHRSSPSPPRLTAEQKGKGRAGDLVRSAPEDYEGDDGYADQLEGAGGSSDEDGSEAGQGGKQGPMPDKARHEAILLAEQTTEAFKALGKKYGKSAQAMMLAGGLGIRASRRDNMYNKFKQWYSYEHPIAEGGRSLAYISLQFNC